MLLNYKRVTSAAAGNPPVPPQRHSSMRGNAPLTPPTNASNVPPTFGSPFAATNANANAVGRLVIDLETKFGKSFHNVTEFPKPPPFLNIPKIYPSRTAKATNAPPPSSSASSTAAATTTNANSNNIANNNNNNITAYNNNTNAVQKPLQPAYAPMKKKRAPAPPPQAGVAAATVSVIRHSSFLYGGSGNSGVGGSGAARPQSQPASNSTIY